MNSLALERAKRELQTAMNEHGIPEHMQGGLQRYILQGIKPGDFMLCVLENNLRGACITADADNEKLLGLYVRFLWSYAPANSYGNTQRRRAWCAHNGLSGLLDSERNAAHA